MAREETVHKLVGDRYSLLEPLGRGGMGTVWRGRDELLQRSVAVKHVAVAALDAADRGAVRDRVIREARAAARLSHPASVTVFDVVEDESDVHIVMELVEADTLAQRVERDGPVPVDAAARFGLALVGALEAAHRQGIVHRDVKPSNVLLPAGGAVKLTDFGIASVKDHPSLTGTGQMLGSPAYMAPEQALSQPSGEEVDWWGLGATLYFAVEGRPPFERNGALATLAAVVHDEPAAPERAGALAPLLARLLDKEPAQRPGPAELREALQRAAHAGEAAATIVGGSDPAGAPTTGARAPTGTENAEGAEQPRPAPAPPPAGPRDVTGPAPAPPPTGPRAVTEPVPAPPPPEPRAVTEPGPAPPPTGPRAGAGPAPGRRRLLTRPVTTTLAALLAVVAVVLAALVWSATRDEGGNGDAGAVAPSTQAGDGARDVPRDWVTYTDPKVGYTIAHPPGWRVRALDGTRTDITDPRTRSYLRIDWTDTPGPSPEGAWEAQSRSFGSRHDQYEEIGIDPTSYKGFDAAVWEYAYSAGGARLHAVNLGFVTGTHGFALNFQTHEQRWEGSQDLFEAFKASFRVPG
ncbi:MAG: serine/threonine-protein kinase [Actinomycetota bacterium]